MNKSHSGSLCPLSPPAVDESVSTWSNVKLKKTQPLRTSSQTSDSSESGELNKIILRKPRSRSTGDLLDNSSNDSATAELKMILQKKRAAAEPGSFTLLFNVNILFPFLNLLVVSKLEVKFYCALADMVH